MEFDVELAFELEEVCSHGYQILNVEASHLNTVRVGHKTWVDVKVTPEVKFPF